MISTSPERLSLNGFDKLRYQPDIHIDPGYKKEAVYGRIDWNYRSTVDYLHHLWGDELALDILDVGCWKGDFAQRHLLPIANRYTGIDIGPEQVVAAQELLSEEIYNGRANIIEMDALQINDDQDRFPDESVDLVTIHEVLGDWKSMKAAETTEEQQRNIESDMKELVMAVFRVLKPQGIVSVSVGNPDWGAMHQRDHLALIAPQRDPRIDPGMILDSMQQQGLDIVRLEGQLFTSYVHNAPSTGPVLYKETKGGYLVATYPEDAFEPRLSQDFKSHSDPDETKYFDPRYQRPAYVSIVAQKNK